MAKKNITIDWNQVFLTYGETLTRRDVCKALNISFAVLDNARKKGIIRESPLPARMITFCLLEVKRYAEEVLGYKSAIIKDDDEISATINDDKEKLAKRFELRKRLFKVMHPEKCNWRTFDEDVNWSRLESFFDWIYNSPMIEWEGKFFCLAEIYCPERSTRCVILDAEELYNKLK